MLEWLSICFLAWVFWALFGGIAVGSGNWQPTHSMVAQVSQAAALLALVLAALLLAYGFAVLLLMENRPVTTFCRTANLFSERYRPFPRQERP